MRRAENNGILLAQPMHTLFHKVWNAHAVRALPSGQTQLFVGLHLIHEVTSPQAFDMLRQHGWGVAFPERTFATVDHIVPTSAQSRPFLDVTAEEMTTALERNCREFGIQLWAPGGPGGENQGIVHVIGPELGLTQPGMTIACGDSHTSTHGALGAVAFGIGTSQVRDVLASQCLSLDPLKVRRIDVNGTLAPGVYAKDVILTIIRRLGVNGGVGYAYEYGGSTDRRDDHRRAHDRVQHVDRGRRASRLRQSRRDDVPVPQGPAVRAVRRGVRPRGRLVAADRVGPGCAATTTASCSTRRRSSRPSRGASTRDSRSGSANRLATAPTRKRSTFMGFERGSARRRHPHRRRLHRIVHQRPVVRPRRSGAAGQGTARGAARQGARRAWLAGSQPGGRGQRAARNLHQGRLRMARRRLLDVPGHEPGPARRPRRSAPHRRTAISRAARAARPAGRCS